MHASAEVHDLTHAHPIVETSRLGNVSKAGHQQMNLAVIGRIMAEYPYPPGGRPHMAEQHANGGCFACCIFSGKTKHFSPRDFQDKVVHCSLASIILGDPVQFNSRVASVHWSSPCSFL